MERKTLQKNKRVKNMSIEMNRSALGTIQTDNDVERLNVRKTKEYVFGEKYLDGRIQLRIYSTISTITNKPRRTGEDAIRVLLYDTYRKKIIDSTKRTHRTKNWRENLEKRVEKLRNVAEQMQKCGCGGILVPRRNKKGDRFFGCTSYPDCNKTKTFRQSDTE